MTRSTATDARMAVLLAKSEEETLRDTGKPYSEAVIQCCELFLSITEPKLRQSFLELYEPHLCEITGYEVRK